MANKVQSKTAIDNAAADAKDDIDTMLPADINIIGGEIRFNPRAWRYVFDAGGDSVKAATWAAFIGNNLTLAGKTPEITQIGRRVDDNIKEYMIVAGNFRYTIKNA